MIVGRIVGWLFLAVAAAVLVWDVVLWADAASFRATALGQHWYDLDRATLGGLQVVIERYIWPPLWKPVAWTLQQPTWAVFGVLGLVLAIGLRRRRRRRRH